MPVRANRHCSNSNNLNIRLPVLWPASLCILYVLSPVCLFSSSQFCEGVRSTKLNCMRQTNQCNTPPSPPHTYLLFCACGGSKVIGVGSGKPPRRVVWKGGFWARLLFTSVVKMISSFISYTPFCNTFFNWFWVRGRVHPRLVTRHSQGMYCIDDIEPFTLKWIPMDNLESSDYLTYMFLECWIKPEQKKKIALV